LFSNRLFALQKGKNDSSLRHFALLQSANFRPHAKTHTPRRREVLFAQRRNGTRSFWIGESISGQQTDLAEIAPLESIFSTANTRECLCGDLRGGRQTFTAIPAQEFFAYHS
jgi:hypothetical protein